MTAKIESSLSDLQEALRQVQADLAGVHAIAPLCGAKAQQIRAAR